MIGFINLNKNALPFEKYAAPLIKQLKDFNLKK